MKSRIGVAKTLAIVIAISLVLGAAVWQIRATILNNALVEELQRTEASVGATPSDESWKSSFGQAVVADHINHDYREALILHMEALTHAASPQRIAASYNSMGLSFEKLGMLEVAEQCHRKATKADPGSDFFQKCLADVLLVRKKYVEAEPIYRSLLGRTSAPDDRSALLWPLAETLDATGRKADADKARAESYKAMDEAAASRHLNK